MLLVLHPHHKLEYFKKQKWEATWIQAAHDIIRHKFDHSYALVGVQGDGDGTQVGNSEAVSRIKLLYFNYYLSLLAFSSEGKEYLQPLA